MPDWTKPRVLHVANDDGHLLTALLTRDGHEVMKADCTSQALNLNALEQFDYIVIERPSPRESVLRESEKRFRATFEQAAVGVAHSSLDGRERSGRLRSTEQLRLALRQSARGGDHQQQRHADLRPSAAQQLRAAAGIRMATERHR